MNKTTTLQKLLYTIAFTSCFTATSAYALECTPDLHVDGKYLKDPNGNIVNLHGVMDTPSMWFNSDRAGLDADGHRDRQRGLGHPGAVQHLRPQQG